MGIDIIIKLALGALDAFEAAEAEQVRLADVGDDAVVGLADLHQLRNVVGMVCAHLNDSQLGSRRYLQQGKRHPDVIVEITFGGNDIVLGGKHGTDKFLGRGLAVGPGDTDYSKMLISKHMLPMIAGQVLQCPKRVRNRNDAAAAFCADVFRHM